MFGRNKEIKKLKERIEIQNKIINNLQRIIDNFGILKGDIIIQLGAIEVTDIYKYMEGLSKYESGDNTTVKVKRQNEIIEISIIF